MHNNTITEEFYTSEEILTLFKIHTQTLKNWRKENKIPFVKITRKTILYPKDKVLAMLKK